MAGEVSPDLFQKQQSCAGATFSRLLSEGELAVSYLSYKKILRACPTILSKITVDSSGVIRMPVDVADSLLGIPEGDLQRFLDIVAVMSLGLSTNQEERQMLVEALTEAMSEQ